MIVANGSTDEFTLNVYKLFVNHSRKTRVIQLRVVTVCIITTNDHILVGKLAKESTRDNRNSYKSYIKLAIEEQLHAQKKLNPKTTHYGNVNN